MARQIDRAKLKQDLECWPGSWMGLDSDIPIGRRIVQVMRLFLEAMLEARFSYTTINRHVGNLWLLGGEIISRVHHDPELKDLAGEQLILRFVDEEGGPYSKHVTTEEALKSLTLPAGSSIDSWGKSRFKHTAKTAG